MILKIYQLKTYHIIAFLFGMLFFLDIPHKVNQGHPQNAPIHKAIKIFLKLND